MFDKTIIMAMILLFVGLLYKGLFNQITMLLWRYYEFVEPLLACSGKPCVLFGRAPLFNYYNLKRLIDIWLFRERDSGLNPCLDV